MARKSYTEIADDLAIAQWELPVKQRYQHYKWQKYRVESLAVLVDDDRNLQTMVVYRPEWHPESVFVRNSEIFAEMVEWEWEMRRRFQICRE